MSGRVTVLRERMAGAGLDAALLSGTAEKRYFAGFRLGRGEEATSGYAGTLLVTADETLLLADSRYTEQAEHEAPGWQIVSTTKSLEEELPELLAERGINQLGLQAQVVTHAAWSALAEAAPDVTLEPFDERLAELRIIKDAAEVDAIGRACALTDACFAHLVSHVRPGMTEEEVAWELESWFRANGAEGLAFEPLVLAGPRAAMPHGRPSSSRIERGNVLLIDFGCQVDGYRSDMTRTVFVGDPPANLLRRHDAVREAQQLAIDALRPGVRGDAVDAIARRRISDDGFVPYGHGLGHGIGLDTHEAPRLRLSSGDELRPGMVFSVEPGIYEPGVTGIRIEDIVVLEADGPRLLTNAPREALVVS